MSSNSSESCFRGFVRRRLLLQVLSLSFNFSWPFAYSPIHSFALSCVLSTASRLLSPRDGIRGEVGALAPKWALLPKSPAAGTIVNEYLVCGVADAGLWMEATYSYRSSRY